MAGLFSFIRIKKVYALREEKNKEKGQSKKNQQAMTKKIDFKMVMSSLNKEE